MAVRLTHVCDRCTQLGQPERSASTMLITINDTSGLLDLCDDHRDELLDGLADLLVSHGRTEDGKAIRKRAARATASPGSTSSSKAATASTSTPTSVEDLSCPVKGCGGGPYSSRTSLQAHLRTYHETTEAELRGEASHVCDICARRFGSVQALAVHRQRKHKARAS